MDNSNRQNQIIDILKEKSPVSVSELANLLQVTPTSIRRDLLFLEETHQILRSRGYAQINPEFYFSAFSYRTDLHKEEKRLIAKKAASLVQPGDSLIIDSGSTCIAFAHQLRFFAPPNLSVLTSCIPVAAELSAKYQVSMSGGVLHHESMTLVGPQAEAYYQSLHTTKAILSSTGIFSTNGITAASPFHVSLKKRILSSASEVILLLDSSKFSSRGIHLVSDFSPVTTIITVYRPQNEEFIERFRQLGITVLLADSPS